MFCTKCGAQNVDGAAFCSSCGASLSTATTSQPTSMGAAFGSQSTPPSSMNTGKSPAIAAFLNLIFGIGYVYLGTKKVLGVQTLVFVLLDFLLSIVLGIFTAGLVSFVLAIILAVDGWQKAKGGKGFVSAEY